MRFRSGLCLVAFVVWCAVVAGAAEPSDTEQLLRDAQKMFSQGQYVMAEIACKKLLDQQPDVYYAYNLLGAIYSLKTNYEYEAISYLTRSLELNPRQANIDIIYGNIASLYGRIGEVDRALEAMQQGLAACPESFPLNLNIGTVYLFDRQDGAAAYPYLEAAHRLRPDQDRALYLLGIAQIDVGKRFDAIEAVTELRLRRNEQLAAELERQIRGFDAGRMLDLQQLKQSAVPPRTTGSEVSVVPAAPAAEKESEPLPAAGSPSKMNVEGTVTIKTRIINKSAPADSEGVSVRGQFEDRP